MFWPIEYHKMSHQSIKDEVVLQFRHYRGAQSGERRFLGVEGVQLVD